MVKLKIFQVETGNRNKIYSISNYDIDPMVTLEFAILPNNNTKKLFSKIWSKYDVNTKCSLMDFREIVKESEDFYSELNTIRFMSFGVYAVEDGEEIFNYYPIIVQTFKMPDWIRIKFHDSFKIFFDKFLEL